MTVAVLCGGVGAARYLRGLLDVVEPCEVVAIVNTADDTVMHGLYISPDLDTITYTLAGAIDPDRGWGLCNETWTAMAALQRFDSVRPAGSRSGESWFGLGDQDLATHFYRTSRLAEGASLSMVTAEIAAAWGLRLTMLPMTDQRVSTIVSVPGLGELSFQEYFVREHHGVAVDGVRFDGAAEAALTVEASHDLRGASAVVIALPGFDAMLAARRDSVVAVSPIIGGAALKGPADRMLAELGMEVSAVGVARLYAPIAGTLVIDQVDAALAPRVEALGMRCVVVDTIMKSPAVSAALARTTLRAAQGASS
jgi:LPPG:FO 2-phospho-L-lactate transferase